VIETDRLPPAERDAAARERIRALLLEATAVST
jgi:hypothetical protein